jgi:uncharacterized protein (TIGR03435 family)
LTTTDQTTESPTPRQARDASRRVAVAESDVTRGIVRTFFFLIVSAAFAVGQDPALQIKNAPRPANADVQIGERFETVTITPTKGERPVRSTNEVDKGRFECRDCPLSMLIMEAFDIRPYQLSGPGWMYNVRFDVSAKISPGITKEKVLVMEQNLLVDRFKMIFHRHTKDGLIYDLVVGADGPKFRESREEHPGRQGITRVNDHSNGGFTVQAEGQSMRQFAETLWTFTRLPVMDRTELSGRYDFTMSWRDDRQPVSLPRPGSPPPDFDSSSNVFRALENQLGLKLKPKKGAIDFLVIDHIEKVSTGN